jgi:hypothetical protein
MRRVRKACRPAHIFRKAEWREALCAIPMGAVGTFAAEAGFQHGGRQVSPQQGLLPMRSIRWLAVVPFLALIVGPFFVNRATPVLDLPFLLAWIVAWVVLTSVIMAVIYAADPANREGEP